MLYSITQEVEAAGDRPNRGPNTDRKRPALAGATDAQHNHEEDISEKS
jgi:hypothetical protein